MPYHPLSPEAIAEALKTLSGWEYRESWLRKTFTFGSFGEAMSFVNKVAELSEEAFHHPDIYVRFNTVVLILQTHRANHQVTQFDVDLARQIETIQSREG
jgi:4a-hydroxytetrahydrobiopterin dehydratase